jgi:hypothetical protein
MEDIKTDLINELIDVSREMENLWQFHPLNPNRKDLIMEYIKLDRSKKEIENKISDLV